MSSSSNTTNQDPLTRYLFERIRADVNFLHSQSWLDNEGKDAILSRIEGAASKAAATTASNSSTDLVSVKALANQFGSAVTVSSQQQQQQQPLPPVRASPQQPQPYSQGTRERAKALWNYSGSQPDDLSFQKGDTIIIHTKENEHWWRGSVESDPSNRSGLFPSNHVEILPPTTPHSAPPPPPPAPYGSQPPPSSYYGGGPPADHEKAALQQHQPYYQQPGPSYYTQPPPPQPYYNQGPPVAAPSPNTAAEEQKKHKFKLGGSGLGNTLAHAGVGGLGFGAGSAVGSGIINSIF